MKRMVLIAKSRVVRAGVDRVWATLVDWNNERKYWPNERDIKVLKSSAATIEREATIGPMGFSQKTRQILVLEPKKSIKLSLEGDSIAGKRTINLFPLTTNETRVDITWSLEISGVPGFVEWIVMGQIEKVTDEALRKIAGAAESSHEEMMKAL